MDGGDHGPASMVRSSTVSWQHGIPLGHSSSSSLRFRPIAPKPANAGVDSCPPPASIVVAAPGSKRGRKRNKTRLFGNGKDRRKRVQDVSNQEHAMENGKGYAVLNEMIPCSKGMQMQPPLHREVALRDSSNPWCRFSIQHLEQDTHLPPMMSAAAESWVTVEFVMNITYYSNGLTRSSILNSNSPTHCDTIDERDTTDAEILRDFEAGACPGFVTDRCNNVMCVNKAYKRMVAGDGQLPNFVTVWLVIKDELQQRICNCSGFSCWLNLKYTWLQEMKGAGQSRAMVVPCDVWRMEHRGGFAWRLDLTAALRLGS